MKTITTTEIKKTKNSKSDKKTKSAKQDIITEVKEPETLSSTQETVNEQNLNESVNEQNLNESDNKESTESEQNSIEVGEILYSDEEFIQKLDTIIESFNYLNENNLKNHDINKEFINLIFKKMNKIDKLHTLFRTTSQDILTKELLLSIKSNGSKKKNPKKVVDKEKCAINLLRPTYKEVLKFLNLPDGTEISRAILIQGINAFVKKEKTENNPDIFVDGDSRSFKLIGDLKVLFEFARKQMILRGDSDEETPLPEKIGYTAIMKYLKYFLQEVKN